jgi:hypothetical protein
MKKNGVSKASQGRKTAPMRKQGLPRGWDARKVRAVIAHYERLTDEELAREIEEAPEETGETLKAGGRGRREVALPRSDRPTPGRRTPCEGEPGV